MIVQTVLLLVFICSLPSKVIIIVIEFIVVLVHKYDLGPSQSSFLSLSWAQNIYIYAREHKLYCLFQYFCIAFGSVLWILPLEYFSTDFKKCSNEQYST